MLLLGLHRFYLQLARRAPTKHSIDWKSRRHKTRFSSIKAFVDHCRASSRLLHYKVYLVCKIRRKMDFEGITPHMLRHDRFREFGENEMAAVDEVCLLLRC